MHRILIQFGPFTIYSYGFFVAMGFLLGAIFILRGSEKYGFSRDSIFDCLLWVLVGGIAGGRLLFVVINAPYYINDPLRIFMLTEGGLAVQGAILSGIFFCWVLCRIKKLPFLRILDLFAPYAALGQSIGRIGCFFNGCCYGRAIRSGAGVIFPGDSVVRIPTQLYSSLGLVILFALLLFLRDKKKYDGFVFFMYCCLYSLFRFFMDYFRGDELYTFYNLTLSQAISVLVFFISILMMLFFHFKKKPEKRNE
jgi:phosphatidylglycerol:prolipoprotein diacylglycerol transferase